MSWKELPSHSPVEVGDLMAMTKISAPGINFTVETYPEYNWAELGAALAEKSDLEQADFLSAFSERLRSLPGPNWLFQVQYIADELLRHPRGSEYDRDTGYAVSDVKRFLHELLVRLEETEATK